MLILVLHFSPKHQVGPVPAALVVAWRCSRRVPVAGVFCVCDGRILNESSRPFLTGTHFLLLLFITNRGGNEIRERVFRFGWWALRATATAYHALQTALNHPEYWRLLVLPEYEAKWQHEMDKTQTAVAHL